MVEAENRVVEKEKAAANSILTYNGHIMNVLTYDLYLEGGQTPGAIHSTIQGQKENLEKLKDASRDLKKTDVLNDGDEKIGRIEKLQQRMEEPLNQAERGEHPKNYQNFLFGLILNNNDIGYSTHRRYQLQQGYFGGIEDVDAIEVFDRTVFSETKNVMEKHSRDEKIVPDDLNKEKRAKEIGKINWNLNYILSKDYLSEKDLGWEEYVNQIHLGPQKGTDKFMRKMKEVPVKNLLREEVEKASSREKMPCSAKVILNAVFEIEENDKEIREIFKEMEEIVSGWEGKMEENVKEPYEEMVF